MYDFVTKLHRFFLKTSTQVKPCVLERKLDFMQLWVTICFNCRNDRPRLTFRTLCYLFCSAIVGLVIFSFLTTTFFLSVNFQILCFRVCMIVGRHLLNTTFFFIGHQSLNTLSFWGSNILLLPSLVLSSTWCQCSHSWWHYLLGMNQNSNIYILFLYSLGASYQTWCRITVSFIPLYLTD